MCILGYAAMKAMKSDKSGEPNTRVVEQTQLQNPRSSSPSAKLPRQSRSGSGSSGRTRQGQTVGIVDGTQRN